MGTERIQFQKAGDTSFTDLKLSYTVTEKIVSTTGQCAITPALKASSRWLGYNLRGSCEHRT